MSPSSPEHVYVFMLLPVLGSTRLFTAQNMCMQFILLPVLMFNYSYRPSLGQFSDSFDRKCMEILVDNRREWETERGVF